MQDELNTNLFFATLLFMYTYKIYNDAQPIQHRVQRNVTHSPPVGEKPLYTIL